MPKCDNSLAGVHHAGYFVDEANHALWVATRPPVCNLTDVANMCVSWIHVVARNETHSENTYY